MNSAHQRERPQKYLGLEDRITAVETGLVAEFRGSASRALVADVVLAARRDLDGEVPPDSLDELLHRLAHQRLLDSGAAPTGGSVGRRQ